MKMLKTMQRNKSLTYLKYLRETNHVELRPKKRCTSRWNPAGPNYNIRASEFFRSNPRVLKNFELIEIVYYTLC